MKKIQKELLASLIEKRAKSDLAKCNIGGAEIQVFQDGELVYKKRFGAADLKEKELSDRTLFRLASMTKPITAAAAMILVDRGLLSLSDRVDRFYPAFSDMAVFGSDEKNAVGITVEHLLTHTSGIGSGEAWVESCKSLTDGDKSCVESFISFLSRQPLSFLPGTKQEYSGIGAFSVLTGIIQKITAMPYPDFLKKEIFEPCGMTDTTFTPTEEEWANLIAMHAKSDGKSTVGTTFDGCIFESFPPESYLGGAGLVSTADDYMRFAKMLLAGGISDGRRILSEAAVCEIKRPRFEMSDEEWWGLGVRVVTRSNPIPIGSYGWSGAYGTHCFIDPENKIIGIYMKNSRHDGGSGAVTSKNLEIDICASLK